MVITGSKAVQNKIGTQYSLVGIDPRGVGDSGPSSDCFPGYSHVARNAFLANIYDPVDITSDYALRQNHEYMRTYGKWCSSVYAVNDTAKYASTVATAQDMLHYIELRAKSKGEPPEEAKLWYYGISYGTILGGTFASLYPDRIGRMIIDGVMDLEDHYNGGWEKSIVDNDEASRYFFKRCFEAGPTLCQFHQNATSWEELEERYANILRALTESPVAVGDLATAELGAKLGYNQLMPTLFKWQDLVSQMFGAAYLLTPSAFTALDTVLIELQTGVSQSLAAMPASAHISDSFPGYDERMARSLISCLDANRRFNTSEFSQYKSFVEDLHNVSIYGGFNTVYQSGPICSHLDVAPPESQSFDGTFFT
jgi:pimeloyl-ACP methyl ester carboxylesterase